MKTLKEVKIGETCKVVRLHGEGAVKRRIMDMGITKGVDVFVRKVAPLGDPVEVTVRGYELSQRKADAIAVAVVTVVVALLGPIFGVLADHKDKKKVLFTTAAALGIFGCILNGFITGWLLFLIIFVFTKICYSASLTIYDSMLNDITSEERMDDAKNMEARNAAVAAGETTDYAVDSGLLQKILTLFETPIPDEIDVWFTNRR